MEGEKEREIKRQGPSIWKREEEDVEKDASVAHVDLQENI